MRILRAEDTQRRDEEQRTELREKLRPVGVKASVSMDPARVDEKASVEIEATRQPPREAVRER